MQDDRLLTVAEVCELVRVHPQSVRRWIKEDGLPAIQFGGRTGYRIRLSDLEAFLAARATGKAGALAA